MISIILAVIVSLSKPAPEAYVREATNDNVGRAAKERARADGRAVERDRMGVEAAEVDRADRAAWRRATVNIARGR